MKQYLDMLKEVKQHGHYKGDRTGTGTQSLFGMQSRYDLRMGRLPVVTTKYVHLKSVIHELLWMLKGSTNVKYLQDNGVSIWDEWANADGELGPVYGKQWRYWTQPLDFDDLQLDTSMLTGGEILGVLQRLQERNTIDQIQTLVDRIKADPEGRRHIVSAWNVSDLEDMNLPPCHAFFQFYLRKLTAKEYTQAQVLHDTWEDDYKTPTVPEYGISCQLYQRSADLFLGVPFNVTFYSLLTHMVGQQVNAYPLDFVWTGGDCHIYTNHEQQTDLQITRTPYAAPRLRLTKRDSIFDYTFDDIHVLDYKHHAAIKGKVAV